MMKLVSIYLRVLLVLTAALQLAVKAADGDETNCETTPQTHTLNDGRTLAYCDFGATSDKAISTVVHCNGSGGSRLEWPGNETMLESLGIRFISIDRPGHGFSDPQPEGRQLLGWPRDDVAQLLDHLMIDKFYVEGWSAGGGYALALAHEFPTRVIRGATLSGIGPFDRPDPLEGLDPLVQMWMEWARDQNVSAVTAFREQSVPFLQSSNASQIGMLLGSGGEGLDDIEVAQNPHLQRLMGANIKEGYRQGAYGPIQDDLVINRPWGFKLQDVQPHIDVWQGEIDKNVPMIQGIYQDSILPNSTLHILNDTAHLFPLVLWEDILIQLVTSQNEETEQNPPVGGSETEQNPPVGGSGVMSKFQPFTKRGAYASICTFVLIQVFLY